MTIEINTKFEIGQRVWMPDGNGEYVKGRVVGITLFHADLTETPRCIVAQSLNYKCIDEQRNKYSFNEYQLSPRKL